MNTDIEPRGDEEYRMPCAEALLAAILALMTAHAQGSCCADHQRLIEQKVTAHLAMAAEHPLLSPDFRTMAWNLRARWQTLQQARPDVAPDPRLWHSSPPAVQ